MDIAKMCLPVRHPCTFFLQRIPQQVRSAVDPSMPLRDRLQQPLQWLKRQGHIHRHPLRNPALIDIFKQLISLSLYCFGITHKFNGSLLYCLLWFQLFFRQIMYIFSILYYKTIIHFNILNTHTCYFFRR